MRFVLTFLVLTALGGLAASAATGDAGGNATAQTAAVGAVTVSDATPQPTLQDLLWVARPVVIFADTPNDPRFHQQMEMLDERRSELIDRDVEILIDTDPGAAGTLRKKLHPRGFGLVIIDKDGTVVQRRPAPTTTRELINMIDRLPSRRQEEGSYRP